MDTWYYTLSILLNLNKLLHLYLYSNIVHCQECLMPISSVKYTAHNIIIIITKLHTVKPLWITVFAFAMHWLGRPCPLLAKMGSVNKVYSMIYVDVSPIHLTILYNRTKWMWSSKMACHCFFLKYSLMALMILIMR